ncbi:hypothetical protein JOL62DRAFT_313837 [Phyllosticta paracitricarpa]|uniref:Uncharacterized protein n=1 Tax=Phyllosticta paracitricarpa TaxID=2016321 RepID=A0ABR1MVD4_9PEZI
MHRVKSSPVQSSHSLSNTSIKKILHLFPLRAAMFPSAIPSMRAALRAHTHTHTQTTGGDFFPLPPFSFSSAAAGHSSNTKQKKGRACPPPMHRLLDRRLRSSAWTITHPHLHSSPRQIRSGDGGQLHLDPLARRSGWKKSRWPSSSSSMSPPRQNPRALWLRAVLNGRTDGRTVGSSRRTLASLYSAALAGYQPTYKEIRRSITSPPPPSPPAPTTAAIHP